MDQIWDGGDIKEKECELRQQSSKPTIHVQDADAPTTSVESATSPTSIETKMINATPVSIPTPEHDPLSVHSNTTTSSPIHKYPEKSQAIGFIELVLEGRR